MKRICIHPGQSVGLPLTETERELVCDSLVIPDEYIARIRANSNKPEVPFTLDDLDDLLGYVASEANHCESKKHQRVLDGVSQKINDLLPRYTDDDTQPDDDELLTDDSDPVDRLLEFVYRLEEVCEAAGFDFEEVLDGMEPTRIRADDTVGLYLSPTEKAILVGLDEVSDDAKGVMQDAPAKKHKFQFTLHQINEFEAAVSTSIEGVEAPKKWKTLVRKLVELQSTYVIDGGDEGVHDDEHASRKVVVRNMLEIVKERRKSEHAES